MRKLLLFLLILITFNPFPVLAQLKVINPNGHAVSLALGFYNETGLIKGWYTQGWINIAPHDSTTLLPNGIVGGEVYYFGRISGCDQLYQGQYSLHIQPKEAFSIANSASDLPISLNKGLEKAPFAKVSIPNGSKTFTLRLPEINCTRQGMRQGTWTL